jgi:hypothetical protein
MAGGKLDTAKKQKADEFYTQLTDIEKELKHYKNQLKGKTVFCNCDDPYWSDFFYFFVAKFNELGLKKLITTHYIDNDITLFDDIMPEKPYSLSITKAPQDLLTLERPAMVTHIIAENGGRHYLKGDGDFRSAECVEMLKEADIVVTNPPFSLFREYVAQLIEYNKKFIIIGNTNALTYKEIFKLVKENKITTGMTNFNVGMYFIVPNTWEKYHKIENGRKLVRNSNSCWFTNLDHSKRHDYIILYKYFNKNEYPKYDNYDAINIDKVADIPMDYEGVMGVPLTFIDKFNPEQFEIIDGLNRYSTLDVAGTNDWAKENHLHMTAIDGKSTYYRVLIRNLKPTKKGK